MNCSMFKVFNLKKVLLFLMIAQLACVSTVRGDIVLEGYHHLGDDESWSPPYIPKDPVTYSENRTHPIHFYLSQSATISEVVLENIVGIESDDNISVFIDGSLVGIGPVGSGDITLTSPLSLNSGFHTIAFQGACYWWGYKIDCRFCGLYCDIDDFYFSAIRLISSQTTDAFNFTQKHHFGDNNDDQDDDYSDIDAIYHPYYPDAKEGLQISYNFTLNKDVSALQVDIFRLRELHGEDEIYLDGNLITQIPIYSSPYTYYHYTYIYSNHLSAGSHTLEIKSVCLKKEDEENECEDYDDVSYDEFIVIPTYITTPSVDHYELWHDRYALTCNPTTVTVCACADANCSSCSSSHTTNATSVELATNSTASSWEVNPQPVHGSQAFSLRNSANETISLSVSSAAPTADYCCVINGSGDTNCTAGDHSACSITFQKSGFLFDQVNATSCANGHGLIKAVKTDDTSQKCIPAFQNKNFSLTFWASYDNPSSGTRKLSVNGTVVGPPSSLAANVTLAFDSNGMAPFRVHYGDAGRLWLGVNGTGNYTFMHGGGYLVFTPAKFAISTPMTNKALTGPPSLQAGGNFTLSIHAQCDNGTDTPNYEDSALMSIEMANPAGATSGALEFKGGTYGVGGGWSPVAFIGGIASDTTTSFSDVGVFRLRVKDDDYFGQQIPEANATIGRFYPDHFRLFSSSVTPGCGTFTYMEQPFNLEFDLVAENAGNGTTANYATDLLGASITADVGLYAEDADNVSRNLTYRLSPSVTGNWTNGHFNYSVDHEKFARLSSPDGPYNVNIGVNTTDQDNIPILHADLDCSGPSCDAKLLNDMPQLFRYGHLDIYSNYGPQTDNLTLSTATVYWDNGWKLNTDDHCTDLNTTQFVLSGWSDNLDPGETSVVATAGISAGEGNITLSAPGEGNWGSVVVDLNSTAYFYDWLSSGLNGTATFGLYRGNDKVIHWFELY